MLLILYERLKSGNLEIGRTLEKLESGRRENPLEMGNGQRSQSQSKFFVSESGVFISYY